VIILVARLEVDPAALPRLRPLLEQTMRSTWEESDCLSYSIAVESEAEGIITIVERWRSEAAVVAYLDTPAMAAFKEAVDAALITMDVKLYDVVGERALPTPPSRPRLTLVANGISPA